MDVEHLDMVSTLERGKTNRRGLQRRHQSELLAEVRAETLLIIDRRHPRLLLGLGIVVSGEFLDALDENRSEHRCVRRQKWPQADGRRGTSHIHQTPNSFSAITTAAAITSHFTAM